jgi:uncharacterized protein (DUF1778 family)
MNDQQPVPGNIKVVVSAKDRRLVERAAKAQKRSISGWARLVLIEAARQQLNERTGT